jgi:hypothetical protein
MGFAQSNYFRRIENDTPSTIRTDDANLIGAHCGSIKNAEDVK